MTRKESEIIAEIDGVCGCDIPKHAGIEQGCGKCNKPHRTHFEFDDGAMLGVLNRWADNATEDEVRSFDYHRKNGGARIELSAANIQTGGRIFGEGVDADFNIAGKDALLQIAGKT